MQAAKIAPTTAGTPSARVVVERPPAGLLRGRAAGPRWLFALISAFSLLVVVTFYVRKWRGRAR
ncbi:MAG TPA: hypothetical protein VG937_02875 [Polyangiaceae bacterium]|jgi:hypothetical protein|nr:hypothetical protein [Polyangiaceae bacterium]